MATVRKPESQREAVLVINLRSRWGPEAARQAVEELERQGVPVMQSRVVRHTQRLLAAVQEATESGAGTVVIGGGDGTLAAVVDLLANRPDLNLGLLPIGTGNEVARVLGIPLDLPGACRVIAEGVVEEVDLAEANGNYFLHTALVGYPAQVNHRVPRWLKRRLGKGAYIFGFLASLFGFRPFRARVTAGGESWEGKVPLVVVGNARFHMPGRVLLPAAAIPESCLQAYMPRDGRWSTLARLAFGLWVTRCPQPESLVCMVGDSISVEADPAQAVDLDGEYARQTPVGFRLARRALRVLVPGAGEQGIANSEWNRDKWPIRHSPFAIRHSPRGSLSHAGAARCVRCRGL